MPVMTIGPPGRITVAARCSTTMDLSEMGKRSEAARTLCLCLTRCQKIGAQLALQEIDGTV